MGKIDQILKFKICKLTFFDNERKCNGARCTNVKWAITSNIFQLFSGPQANEYKNQTKQKKNSLFEYDWKSNCVLLRVYYSAMRIILCKWANLIIMSKLEDVGIDACYK